jgi:hypothetical protein
VTIPEKEIISLDFSSALKSSSKAHRKSGKIDKNLRIGRYLGISMYHVIVQLELHNIFNSILK